MTRRMTAPAMIIAIALVWMATAAGQQKPDVERAYKDVIEADSNAALEAAIKRYKAVLPKSGSFYVVEGDLIRTDKEVEEDLLFARASTARIQQEYGPELIIALKPNGARDYWADPKQRTLSYSIDRKSFSSPMQADETAQRMRAAADDWERLCPECGIRFVMQEDPEPSHSRVLFIVRQLNAGGTYVAAAFFPSYAAKRRYLNIDPSFFTTSLDRTGILRHELGHTLGYRHEHIRSIPGCYREGTQWVPLTAYDPKSVMHYLCGGGGTRSLELTELDRQGHLQLYRPPSSE